jgi:hypothetical protein
VRRAIGIVLIAVAFALLWLGPYLLAMQTPLADGDYRHHWDDAVMSQWWGLPATFTWIALFVIIAVIGACYLLPDTEERQ